MTYSTHQSLQQALYQHLKNDATLNDLVSGIFDHVPQGSEYPFVTIGEAQVRDRSNIEKGASDQLVTIRVWSKGEGRKEASAIMERIAAITSRAELTLSGCVFESISFLSSTIALQNDGTTTRGSMNFRAFVREE